MTANKPQRTFGTFLSKKDDQGNEQESSSQPIQAPPTLKGQALPKRHYIYGQQH